MMMHFIPTHCDVCARPGLMRANDIIDGLAICTECGRPARALPGESYMAEDVTLFTDIAAALRDAGIKPSHAALLATELETRALLAPGRCLRRLTEALPSLGVLELLAGSDPSDLRKAEGMVATLLDAMGRNRVQSGFIGAADAAPAATSGDASAKR